MFGEREVAAAASASQQAAEGWASPAPGSPAPGRTVDVHICPDPIFVVGSPRSGTSVLAWSLAQHSGCWTSHESDILYHLFGRTRFEIAYRATVERADTGWLTANGVEREELLSYIGLGFNALFSSRSEGRRWIDQSPSHTLMADLLADMFPSARFVHILRDGRQVVNSMVHSGFHEDWAEDFAEACRAWSHFVEVAMRFSAERPGRATTVTLDRLSAAPELAFADLLAWLRLGNEPGPAEFFHSNRINSSYTRPEARTGLEVWSRWSDDQRRLFGLHAAETLVRYDLASESELQVPALFE